MKIFKTITSVNTFLKNFGSSLDFINNTCLISNDINVDIKYSLKEWVECGCPFPFKIYIRKHGTFTNWDSISETNNIAFHKDQKVGVIIITKADNYEVTYNTDWIEELY